MIEPRVAQQCQDCKEDEECYGKDATENFDESQYDIKSLSLDKVTSEIHATCTPAYCMLHTSFSRST